MRQRPVFCLAVLMFLIFRLLPAGFFYGPRPLSEKCDVSVTGYVSRLTEREKNTELELKGCEISSQGLRFQAKYLLVYLAGTAEYPVGTALSLSGMIYPTEEPTNPGQFDSRLYYHGRGVDYTVYADSVKVQGRRPAFVRQALADIRKKLGEVYQSVLNERDSGLLRAMVLGERGGIDEDTKKLYQQNGISHLLAISGLHISLVGMGLYRLLKRLSGFYALSGIPTVLFLWAYGWMTGASVSTVRAVLMCMLMILADLVGRTYDTLTALGAAALVLMLTDPLCTHQSAFMLSFGAVLAIALLMPLWKLYCGRMGKLLSALSVSLSVLVVTFPLLLQSFYEYPLYSTMLNLLVIPLMSVLMVCALLCGLAGLAFLPAARIAGYPCHWILSLYEWMGRVCLSLPGAVQRIGSPAGWKIVLYYALAAAAVFLLYRQKRKKKYWRRSEEFCPSKGALFAALMFVAIGTTVLCLRVHTGLELTMLDVGQGDSIFMRSPSGTTILYDGGSTSESAVGEYRLLPFLKSQGVGTLDYAMISHMDQDHISGLKELIMYSMESGGADIGHAVLPDLKEKDEAYLEMERLFKEAGIPILYMKAGDRLSEKEFSLSCLWPEEGAVSDDRNDLSMVLLAEYGNFQCLLTGDIGEKTEAALVSSGRLSDVEVLKTAHHGSRYSSAEEFLARVRPNLSLISCSETNRYGHPGEETLMRLADAGSRILITKDCGAIRVWTDGHTVRARGFAN